MKSAKQKIKKLREFQAWRRGAETEMLDPKEIDELLDWAIEVCDSSLTLASAKGRHNSETAYTRLCDALKN